MHEATVKFQITVLRLAKGAIAAWEDWLGARHGVRVPRAGDDWLKQAEIIGAAQLITAEFNRRQQAKQEHAQVS